MTIICSIGTLHWLDFLYTCSYIKLAATLTKLIPQVLLNYRRKSTVGWSIEVRLLDFTGGVFSILQMFFNSYNFGKLHSKFEYYFYTIINIYYSIQMTGNQILEIQLNLGSDFFQFCSTLSFSSNTIAFIRMQDMKITLKQALKILK